MFAKFSRADEQQADEGGFQNMLRAGYNPTGMLTFFQKLLAEEQASGGSSSSAVSTWFSDHPGTEDRIADIQRMLSQTSPADLQGKITDDAGFDAMKQELARLPAAPPPAAQQ